ncbi:MAG: DUF268 domain-containing protein [Sulfuricurvum sp.]|uniref:DUF268 domain-containing protein n=1 Tax=Sulfuricurvum sp. TaxID=2025608 RepID=UPI002736BFD4|nr:DUF268 domain-containing protein [Sulfuricurvum sp.]MDP3290526.1 DUF268 domain-containing protein [Sulfuricurvum sp.]
MIELAKLFIRLLNPILDITKIRSSLLNILRYPVFIRELLIYRSLTNEKVSFLDLWPMLNDKSSASQTGGGHYFYQDNWALNKVYQSDIKEHFDIGSRIDGFVSQCSVFTKVNFIDFRYVEYPIENMQCIEGDILNLPFKDNSLNSISCLHVIEHIGLGRYGDPINPNGSISALKELQRVLAPGGNLYLGIPIGRERVMFHAHRIFNPKTIIETLNELNLIEFNVVNDKGELVRNANLDDYHQAFYSLGLFHLKNKTEYWR